MWCCMRAIEGKSPWFAEKGGIDAAVEGVCKFHGPAMLCVQKPKSNDPSILSRNQVFPQNVCRVTVAYVPQHGACGRKRNR